METSFFLKQKHLFGWIQTFAGLVEWECINARKKSIWFRQNKCPLLLFLDTLISMCPFSIWTQVNSSTCSSHMFFFFYTSVLYLICKTSLALDCTVLTVNIIQIALSDYTRANHFAQILMPGLNGGYWVNTLVNLKAFTPYRRHVWCLPGVNSASADEVLKSSRVYMYEDFYQILGWRVKKYVLIPP